MILLLSRNEKKGKIGTTGGVDKSKKIKIEGEWRKRENFRRGKTYDNQIGEEKH